MKYVNNDAADTDIFYAYMLAARQTSCRPEFESRVLCEVGLSQEKHFS